jgi:hypothetical protein
MQDARQGTGRHPGGPLGSTSGRAPTGMQDAHKGRPSYGRGLGVWRHVLRKSTYILLDGLVAGRDWDANAHLFTQASMFASDVREICANNTNPRL